jgi:hypothetical protein
MLAHVWIEEKVMYFYELVFEDGRKVRRERVTKRVALAIEQAMKEECILFKLKSMTWGVMQ